MKKIITYILSLFILCACSHTTSTSDNNNLEITFTLTDTTGRSVSKFHPHENFLLSFTLANTLKDTLTYYRGSTAPVIIFQISKNDSLVTSSVDGYIFIPVVLGGVLAPDHKLENSWKAPTTPAQYPKIILNPGNYEAKVLFPTFNEVTIDKVMPITFEIVD